MKIFNQKYLVVDIIVLAAILISAMITEFHPGKSSSTPGTYSLNFQNDSCGGNKLIVLGDLQKTSFWEKVIGRESNDRERKLIIDEISKENPGLIVLLGDLVFDGSSESNWQEFDQLIKPNSQKNIPLRPILGNHDYWGLNKSALKNFSYRFKQFTESRWYTLTFDSLAMIFLDSNIDDLSETEWNEQRNWFEKQLSIFDNDSSVIGVFVFFHHPPYTNSTVTGDEVHVQKTFVPAYISSKKGLAMITGHAHGYERFFKQEKTFIVSAGGGGPRVELKDSTEAQHTDLLVNDPDTTSKRPFNFLIVERVNKNVRIVVRGLLKNTNQFFDLEEFTLPVH